jgi:hypothetical protein
MSKQPQLGIIDVPVEVEITDKCLLVEVVELVDVDIISIKNKLF